MEKFIQAKDLIGERMEKMESVLNMLTNGMSTKSIIGSIVRTYRIGVSGTYAMINGIDKDITIFHSFIGMSKKKSLREFVYSLEGTKLFEGRLFRLADVLGEIERNEIVLEEYRLEVKEEDGATEVELTISTDYTAEEEIEEDIENGPLVLYYSESLEEVIEEESEDEENPEVLYDSTDEQDEEQDEDNNGIIYDWSLEVAGKEDSATYHPTLRSLIDYAMSDEECLRKGAYVTRFDGETYSFVQELTNTINKMLKSIEVDEKLPF